MDSWRALKKLKLSLQHTKMSSKNTLQEYFQKKRKQLPPPYDTQRISTVTEAPLFRSVINIDGCNYCGEGSTKVDAEKDAAQHALDGRVSVEGKSQFSDPAIVSIQRTRESIGTFLAPVECVRAPKYASIREISIDNYQVIYLIDGDNCNVENEHVFKNKTCLFIYFIAKNNTKPFPFAHQEQYDNCCVFVADTVARDAVDHMISFFLGQMVILWSTSLASLSRPQDRQYFIVTRDHFGECLEKMAPNCHLVCSV
jgi:hypothetical protein